VVHATRDEFEHVALARSQNLEIDARRTCGRRLATIGQEGVDLADERLPGFLFLEQDEVRALQRHQARARDEARKLAALFERNADRIPRMEYQCRASNERSEPA